MKKHVVVSMMLVTAAGVCQQMVPPAPQLKEFAFFAGSWKGSERYHMGAQSSTGEGSIEAKLALGGMYYQSTHHSTSGNQTVLEGMQMLTYDAQTKRWLATWFDSATPGGMEMTGTLKHGVLVLVSKPTAIPGMPGKVITRATWARKSPTRLDLRLDMGSGGKWQTLVTGTYTKVGG